MIKVWFRMQSDSREESSILTFSSSLCKCRDSCIICRRDRPWPCFIWSNDVVSGTPADHHPSSTCRSLKALERQLLLIQLPSWCFFTLNSFARARKHTALKLLPFSNLHWQPNPRFKFSWEEVTCHQRCGTRQRERGRERWSMTTEDRREKVVLSSWPLQDWSQARVISTVLETVMWQSCAS